MNKRKYKILLGLLAVVALQLFLLFAAYRHPDALAQEAETAKMSRYASNPLVGATGTCGIGDNVSVLFLIDTEKKQLALYYSRGGRDLRFVAARKIFYDLELMYYNDSTQKTHSVKKLKQLYEKSQRDKEGRGSSRRKRR
jgi:hypothetical protein